MEDYASEKQTVGQSRWQDEANDLENSLKDGVMPFETDSQPTGILPHPQAAHVDNPAGNLSFQPLPADPHTVGDPISRNSKQAPSLASCRLCRQRKIKCDRTIPCSNCVRVGEDCMPIVRSKVPRGRQGGRKRKTDGELLERIAKLENLVKDIEGSPSAHGTTSQHVDSGLSSLSVRDGPAAGYSNGAGRSGAEKDGATTYQGRNDIDRYLGASFFLALTDGIGGLKDVLEGSSDDEDEPELGQGLEAGSMKSAQEQLQHSNDPGLIIFPSLSAESPSGPTPHQLYTFCEIYLTNVDPVFKILHAPSLRRFLQEGAPELDCSPGLRGLDALKLAICYTATLSMAEGECRHRMGEERAVLMAKYRACTEQALAKADLVNTVEMSTLQAMTIYFVKIYLHYH